MSDHVHVLVVRAAGLPWAQFLFVPHLGAVHTLLDHLGVGSEKAA